MTSIFEPPHAPRSIAETGIELGMLQDLALKTLYFKGSVTADTIAERMSLPLDPTASIVDFVRKERLYEILGSDTPSAGGCRYALTNSGFARVMSVGQETVQYVCNIYENYAAYTLLQQEKEEWAATKEKLETD
jgi:hypothetical protein